MIRKTTQKTARKTSQQAVPKFKKILFFADGAKNEKAALSRAIELANEHGALLHLMSVVDPYSTNDPRLNTLVKKLQDSSIRDRVLVLEKLIKSLPGKHRTLKKLVVAGKDYVEVIKMVSAEKYDLLIKCQNPRSALLAPFFGDNDIRLLHLCPCPVLVLKPGRRKKFRKVLVAVDPIAENSAALQMNNAIMDTAISVAELSSAALNVLHIWDLPIARHAHPRVNKDEIAVLHQSLKEDSERKLANLVEDYRHVPLKEHLMRGNPARVISQFVEDHAIDLLVMGTVARSGVPGFIVGNTAEKILSRVECSVLALKPKGWRSPVT